MYYSLMQKSEQISILKQQKFSNIYKSNYNKCLLVCGKKVALVIVFNLAKKVLTIICSIVPNYIFNCNEPQM